MTNRLDYIMGVILRFFITIILISLMVLFPIWGILWLCTGWSYYRNFVRVIDELWFSGLPPSEES